MVASPADHLLLPGFSGCRRARGGRLSVAGEKTVTVFGVSFPNIAEGMA